MKAFRSINQFNRYYLPNKHAEDERQKRLKDPAKYGTGLAEEAIESVRKQLRKTRPGRLKSLGVG